MAVGIRDRRAKSVAATNARMVMEKAAKIEM
jgi:hypothetical protein